MRILLKEPKEIENPIPTGKENLSGNKIVDATSGWYWKGFEKGKQAVLAASVEVAIDEMAEAWLKELDISHSLEEVQVIDTFKGKQRLFSQFLIKQITEGQKY